MIRKAKAVLAVAIGFAAFLLWISLVGPQIHVVESVMGLAIAAGAGLGVWYLLRSTNGSTGL